MGAVCGWFEAFPAGRRPAAGIRDAMTRALAHRGAVQWIDGAGPAVAADTAFNSPESIAALSSGSNGDGRAFAAGLHGSFAVAAFDAPRRRLHLVRDRLGERPLYYVATSDGVAFASEIKAILAARVLPDTSIRPEALDAYLAFAYIPAPWTIFAAVRKVPAGHVVTIDLDAGTTPAPVVSSAAYWQPPERGVAMAEPAAMLAELDGALERRLPPAGAVACFLSGGLDSSLVAALAARRLAGSGRRLATFSAGFEERELDESEHARGVARDLGADHHEVRIADITPDLVGRVVRQLDEPMADAACIPNWLLAETTAAVAPVALTGDGADALLAGDHWFRRVQRLDRVARLPPTFRHAVGAVVGLARGKAGERLRKLVELSTLDPAMRYLRIREKWPPAERHAIYAAGFHARLDPAAAAATYTGAPVTWRPGRSVEAAVRLDTLHGLPEGLLMKADKMGMAHGLELRSPFLDRRFAEWAGRLPIQTHLKGGVSKYLLRRAAGAILPRGLIDRRKQGFQVPMGRWLRGPLRPLVDAAFEPDFVERQAIFDPDAMRGLRGRFDLSPPAPGFDGRIWQMVALQTWWRATLL